MDVNQDTTFQATSDQNHVNTVVPPSDDWGIVDCIVNVAGIGVQIANSFMDIVEIVAPIAGILLLSSNTTPNVRLHLYGRHTVRKFRFQDNNGLSISPGERELLQEFLAYKKRLALEDWADDQGAGQVRATVSVVQESSEEPHSPKSEKQAATLVQRQPLAKSAGLPLMRRASFQY